MSLSIVELLKEQLNISTIYKEYFNGNTYIIIDDGIGHFAHLESDIENYLSKNSDKTEIDPYDLFIDNVECVEDVELSTYLYKKYGWALLANGSCETI